MVQGAALTINDNQKIKGWTIILKVLALEALVDVLYLFIAASVVQLATSFLVSLEEIRLGLSNQENLLECSK